MKRSRLLARIRQFWHAIFAVPTAEGLKRAQGVLTPKQYELFRSLPSQDQAHALRVLGTLQARRENHPDLLVAALLHDVGKARYPLRLWERVIVVLYVWLLPSKAISWGRGRARGWRRSFVISRQHPIWGSEMAAKVGASRLAVRLIWRHRETLSTVPTTTEDRLLRALQAADDDS